MAPKRELPKSKQQIKCGHCGVEMRRDRLGEHTKTFHQGRQNKEYGSQSIADMFARKTSATSQGIPSGVTSSSSTTAETGPTSTRKRQRSDDSESDSDDVIASKRSKSDDREYDTQEMESNKARIEENVGTESMESVSQGSTSTSQSMSNSNSIIGKLENVISSLSELKISVDRLNPGLVTQQKQSEGESGLSSEKEQIQSLSALRVLIQNCKSINRLCELAGVTFNETNDTLCCDVCNPDNENPHEHGHGVFGYDFSLGADFTTASQPQKFTNLKKSVAKHIGTQNHMNMCARKDKETEELRKMRSKQQNVGFTVGKQAYKVVKVGRPFSDFERDLQLMAAANVNVGNMNHSRMFPSQMRASFAEAIDSRIKNYCKTPLSATGTVPPVGIIADKVTTRRRTGHMYGAILFTPNMPNLLTSVSLGMVAVKGHDGECIANDIKNVCKQYELQSNQIAGFGFDGQYFNLHVPEKLKEKLHLDDDVTFQWDPAHLLQLADKDMRKEAPWIENICKDIAAVLQKFAYGKTFEAAIDKAAELGVDLKAPLWFSETRFATYAHLVFKNFVNNYSVVRNVLEEIAETGGPRAEDACNLLRRIRTIDFIVKAILLMDFYRVLGEVSQVLQRVNATIWEKSQSLRSFMEILDKMTAWENEQFMYFRTHEAALHNGEFANFPVLLSNVGLVQPLRRTRQMDDDDEVETEDDQIRAKLESIKQEVTNMTTIMSQKLNVRFSDDFFQKIRDKEDAASLIPILSRARSSNNELELLQSREFHDLARMHPNQEEGVRNLCINIFRNKTSMEHCQNDIDIYHKVFSEPSLYLEAQHILATIAKIICSSPPESVVESMGSVVETIRQVRGGFKSSTSQNDIKNMSDELIVHWNGPPLSQCDSIVKQALNIHFRGHSWHFIATDVRAKMHKVSVVVDRLNNVKANLTFMN